MLTNYNISYTKGRAYFDATQLSKDIGNKKKKKPRPLHQYKMAEQHINLFS